MRGKAGRSNVTGKRALKSGGARRIVGGHKRGRHSAPKRSLSLLVALVGCIAGLALVAIAVSTLLTDGSRAARAVPPAPTRQSAPRIAGRVVVSNKATQMST